MGYIRVHCGNDFKNLLELGEGRVTIGRTEDNTLVLGEEGVSRQHAVIEYEDGDYFIVDLDSQNGVFLNNERIKKAKLNYWDEIQIHNFVIKFMATQGAATIRKNENKPDTEIDEDKTKFFNISNEKQLDDLRKKTKECFLIYKDKKGHAQRILMKKPRFNFGKSTDADFNVGGWFAPALAAEIERLGSSYELVPHKRGKIIFQNQKISKPIRLTDGTIFSVRGMNFQFFNRLTKTS